FLWPKYCKPALRQISTGRASTPIMNALLRTALKYSVTATHRILRIFRLLRSGRGNADEDVVQGRLCHFEQVYPRPCHQRLEQVLGIAHAADLLALAKLANRLHSLQSAQCLGTALDAQAHGIGAVARLNCGKRSVQHLATLIN